MLIRTAPDTLTKITQMGDATFFEPAGDVREPVDTTFHTAKDNRVPKYEQYREIQEKLALYKRRTADERFQSGSLEDCISNVSTPTGSKPVLKTMLTTACERNCNYCPFRAGRGKTPRITLTPDELARGFDGLVRSGKIDGLFLSSGIIKGSVTTQDRLIDTAELIRHKYRYRGYLHLKLMPGAEYDQVYRTMQLADRVSVNLEGANAQRLNLLAPKKDFDRELMTTMAHVAAVRTRYPYKKLAQSVTQFVVGAVGDTDVELLTTTEKLYRQMGLKRTYFSAFGPVAHTPFENVDPVNPTREFRLYQASFLLRDYQWDLEDLPFEGVGNLRLDIDPKRAWAEKHLQYSPIEINTATREQLMRVPGIGAISADAVIRARALGRITDLSHLRKIGVRAPDQAATFITIDGRKPTPAQLPLF